VRENQTIIRCDVCDHLPAWNIYLILPSNERYWQVDLVRFDRIVPVAGCGGCPGMFAFACRAKLHSINAGDGWSIRLHLSSIRPSIGTKNPIPEEMDHREIAVRVPVMNEMQFLFPSEPCKSLKPRSLYVVFLIEKDMRVERRRTRD
jgi:hypothetical protein